MADTPPLLATKIFLPPVRTPFVPRPHLHARLAAGLHAKLILVAAPAGWGKSSSVAAWLHEAQPQTRAAWVALDAGDNDPQRFWSYVVAALRPLQPDLDAAVLPLLHASQTPVEAVLTALLNTLSRLEADVVLVLDDYHVIDSPAIHDALQFLLDHLPSQLHLALTSRADPPLALARLRVRGELVELRVADLRFTAEEAAQFLRETMGLGLTAEQVAMLDARTEGWIAGLQLAALAMRDRSDVGRFIQGFSGTNRFVLDYLAQEVLAQLPTHLRDFVLETSVLERLSGRLCDAVVLGNLKGAAPPATGHIERDSYSQLILSELERLNLFLVPLDDERLWYRYHHLFAEVLRQQLSRAASPAHVKGLYLRAAAAEPSPVYAVRYYLLAEAWGEAAQLIEVNGGALLRQGQHHTLQHWIEALPEEFCDARPRLLYLLGVCAGYQGDLQRAQHWLERAHAGFVNSGDSAGQGEALADLAAHAVLSGDLSRAFALTDQALALPVLPRTRAHLLLSRCGFYIGLGNRTIAEQAMRDHIEVVRSSEDRELLAIAMAGTHPVVGSLISLLTPMEHLYQDGLAALGNQVSPARVGAGASLAMIRLLRGQLEQALETSERAIGVVDQLDAYKFTRAELVLVAARVHIARHDNERAEEFLTRGLRPEERIAMDHLSWAAHLFLFGRFLWQQQRLSEAQQVYEQMCEAATPSEISLAPLVRDLLGAALAISEERYDDAELMLRDVAAREDDVCLMPIYGSAHVLLSHLAHVGGQMQAAAELLRPLLAACERDNTPGRFMIEGPYAAELLRVAVAHGVHAGFAARILTLWCEQPPARDEKQALVPDIAPSHRPVPSVLAEPLSERELEVLALLATGLPNQAIAAKLIVGHNTIKKHLSNIYAKLGVQSRTEALVRARELHLL